MVAMLRHVFISLLKFYIELNIIELIERDYRQRFWISMDISISLLLAGLCMFFFSTPNFLKQFQLHRFYGCVMWTMFLSFCD